MIASMIPSATTVPHAQEADIGKIIWAEVMTANCEGTVSGIINNPRQSHAIGTPTIQKSGMLTTLADAGLKGNFFNPHNNTPVSGALSWDALPETPVQCGQAYDWTFMAAEEANYHTAHGRIILWPATTGSGDSSDYMPPAANATILHKAPNQRLMHSTVTATGVQTA